MGARQFRYIADPVCITALLIYPLNRWLLKPHGIGGEFGVCYLNDILCLPLFLPMILYVQRRIGLRSHDGRPRMWEILQHWAIFSVLFEVILPRYPKYFRSVADPLDVVAYLAGGLAAALWWHWSAARCRGVRQSQRPDQLRRVEMHTVKSILVSTLLTVFLCLGGCSHSKIESKPPATKPTLVSVDYHSRIYLASYDKHITITSDGRIRREGSRAKGEEGIATGHLTAAQMAKLVEMFGGWERVNDNYPGFPDGPEYEITYNGKTVKFGGPAPDALQLWEIRGELERLASALEAGE